jgi:tetratricopeptide (TPR) repeat protein
MEFHRPTSESELDALLKTVVIRVLERKYPEALAICDWLIEDPATAVAGSRERSTVQELMGEAGAAIADLNKVIESGTVEPADFHALGILPLKNGDTAAAVESFTCAIDYGAQRQFNYHTNSSLLFRAEAFLKLTDYENALKDASRLPESYEAHVAGQGMRSKKAIISEATLAIEKRS